MADRRGTLIIAERGGGGVKEKEERGQGKERRGKEEG